MQTIKNQKNETERFDIEKIDMSIFDDSFTLSELKMQYQLLEVDFENIITNMKEYYEGLKYLKRSRKNLNKLKENEKYKELILNAEFLVEASEETADYLKKWLAKGYSILNKKPNSIENIV